MHQPVQTTRQSPFLLIAGMLMIATTLRVTFTGVSPLLEMIRESFDLTSTQIGILTTLPLLAFAVISSQAAGVSRRLGIERSLFGAMLVICLGICLRSAGSVSLLYIGTAVIGCGIALGNVLLPSLIKRDFPHQVPRLTGAYSLTMGIAAALGSLAVAPLALSDFGWQGALLFLMIFPVCALLLWAPQLRNHAAGQIGRGQIFQPQKIWRSALAWQITLFLGLNSLIYYIIVGWLPAILLSLGYSQSEAGSLHGVLQLASALPGLLLGLVLSRFNDQQNISVAVSVLCILGGLGLWLLPAIATLWVVILGFGCGASMILGLTLIGLRTQSAHQAAALSGMAQTFGYLLASFGPPLIGKLHDMTHSWIPALVIIAVLSAGMATFGGLAGRAREIAG